jgi:hypothetical protein
LYPTNIFTVRSAALDGGLKAFPSSNFNFPLLLILSSVDISHGLESALEARMRTKREVLEAAEGESESVSV